MLAHALRLAPSARLTACVRGAATLGAPRPPLSASAASLLHGILAGDRSALARSITLIESSRADHNEEAKGLLDAVLDARARERAASPHADDAAAASAAAAAATATNDDAPPLLPPPPPAPRTFRLGLAGAPGVGKSSLIEALGMHVTHLSPRPLRVAVLAVDPSSSRSGGSILGDKTRMPSLSVEARAYVRPSPTRGALGGVARHTNDIVLLCEGAGYDVVMVETVGLGQSEVAIDSTVDMTLLLVAPGGGDELQGVKKGIVEVADAVVVTKADGALAGAAAHAAAEYARALGLVRPKHSPAALAALAGAAAGAAAATARTLPWTPPVLRVSTADVAAADGIAGLWRVCADYWARVGGSGLLAARRRAQAHAWAASELEAALVAQARASPRVAAAAAALEAALGDGAVTPRHAGELLLRAFHAEHAGGGAQPAIAPPRT